MVVRRSFAMIRRAGGFAAPMLFTALIGLLSIPVVINSTNANAWASIAVGQSVATLFGVLVSFGWGTTGPNLIARCAAEKRPQLYLDSLVSRLYLFMLFMPVAAGVSFALNNSYSQLGAVACVSAMIPFLGASWYFVGQAKPGSLFLRDFFPQAAGTMIGLACLTVTRDGLALVYCQMAGNVVGVTISAFHIVRTSQAKLVVNMRLIPALKRLRAQGHGVIVASTSTLYVNLPVMVVSTLAPMGLPMYVMGDKFFRYGVAALGPITQVLQGWIPQAGPRVEIDRIRRIVPIAPLLGLLGGLAIAFLAPYASVILSHGRVTVESSLSVPVGVIFFAVSISQIYGLACLLPLNEGRALAVSTAAGALAGVPAILIGAHIGGYVGVAWAVGLSEAVVASYQTFILVDRIKRSSLVPLPEERMERLSTDTKEPS